MTESAQYKDFFGNDLIVKLDGSNLDCQLQGGHYSLSNQEALVVQGAILKAATNPISGKLNIQLDTQSYPENQNQIHITHIPESGEVIAGMLTENPKAEPLKLHSIEVPRAMAGSLVPADHPLGKACESKGKGEKIGGL